MYVHIRVYIHTGEVHSWGFNARGQLGLNDRLQRSSPHNTHINKAVKSQWSNQTEDCVCKVMCGAHYSAALTRAGHLYMWGSGELYRYVCMYVYMYVCMCICMYV
jgi:alpha-tubulin suppressor-like RCC1 family protein